MKNVWTCNFLCVHNKLKLFDMISTWHSIMKVVMVPDCETAVVFGNFCPSRSIPALSRTGICHIEALAELQEFIWFQVSIRVFRVGSGCQFLNQFVFELNYCYDNRCDICSSCFVSVDLSFFWLHDVANGLQLWWFWIVSVRRHGNQAARPGHYSQWLPRKSAA